MSLTVIAGQLFSATYVAQGVKFNSLITSPHEDVGFTRVIHITKLIAANRSINCPRRVQLDDRDYFRALGPASGFALADVLANKLSELSPRRHGSHGKEAAPMDGTRSGFNLNIWRPLRHWPNYFINCVGLEDVTAGGSLRFNSTVKPCPGNIVR